MKEAVNEKDPSTIPFGWLNDVPDDPAVSKGHRLLRSYFQITAASNLADQKALREMKCATEDEASETARDLHGRT